MKQKRTLRAMLLQIVFILVVSIMLILAAVIFLSLNLIQKGIVEQQNLLINTLAQQGDEYLAETERLMDTIASTMVAFSPEAQSQLMAQSRANYPRFSAFHLLDETGQVILENTDTRSLLNLDLSGQESFHQVRDTGQTYYSKPSLSPVTEQTSLTLAVPVLANSQFQGVLIGELSLDRLQQDIAAQNKLKEDTTSFIVDQSGTLLAHPNQDWVQERRNFGNLAIVQQGLAGQEPIETFYDENQAEWVGWVLNRSLNI